MRTTRATARSMARSTSRSPVERTSSDRSMEPSARVHTLMRHVVGARAHQLLVVELGEDRALHQPRVPGELAPAAADQVAAAGAAGETEAVGARRAFGIEAEISRRRLVRRAWARAAAPAPAHPPLPAAAAALRAAAAAAAHAAPGFPAPPSSAAAACRRGWRARHRRRCRARRRRALRRRSACDATRPSSSSSVRVAHGVLTSRCAGSRGRAA